MASVDGIPMKDQSFEEFARAWIYLLSATENMLALMPVGSDFAFEFKWTPKAQVLRGDGPVNRRPAVD